MRRYRNLFLLELDEIKKSVFFSVVFSIAGPVVIYLLLFRMGDSSEYAVDSEFWWYFKLCVATFPVIIFLPLFVSLLYGERYSSCEGKFVQEVTGFYNFFTLLSARTLVHTLYLLVNVVVFLFILLMLTRMTFAFRLLIFMFVLLYLGVVLEYIVGFLVGFLCRGNLFIRAFLIVGYLIVFVLPGVLGLSGAFNYVPGVNILLQLKSVFLFNEFNYYLLGYIFVFDILLFLIFYIVVKKKLYR